MHKRVVQITVNIAYDEDIINREELFEAVTVCTETIDGVIEILNYQTLDKTREYK